ncbi:hypothetical protein JIN85_13565 [Luteolibacter pohnpeiensis]|uniref:Uncharacterized protein n=1 Tax=Luteolibacter pohnpeiensis TaxID=454153 RepID=A0A934SCM5_9BACT|nr:hypothetical protein [Luteolibacter pohnpeiensis]MBK1883449.1 hypothetical protein [Luteolibacter pohnpeiensis]
MKSICYALALGVFTAVCHAGEEWESDYPLISGRYEVIGRHCESEKLFTGTITIREDRPNVFVVTRIIDGKKIIGSGKVESATPDKIPVFRIRFVEDGVDYEGTFLWRDDLDNEGRISGYVYTKDYRGKKPGLEALFAEKKSAEQVEAPNRR